MEIAYMLIHFMRVRLEYFFNELNKWAEHNNLNFISIKLLHSVSIPTSFRKIYKRNLFS